MNILHVVVLIDEPKIHIEGMLSPIFKCLGVNLNLIDPLRKMIYMDGEHLEYTHACGSLPTTFPNV